LSLYKEIKDEWGEGLAIQSVESIGDIYASQGQEQYFGRQFEEALHSYEQALKIYESIQDRAGQARVLYGLGMAYDIFNRPDKASEYFRQSLVIAREAGNRELEGRSFSSLGVALLHNGVGKDLQEIVNCYEESLVIAQEIGDSEGQILALQNLGNFAVAVEEEYARGAVFYRRSFEVAQSIRHLFGMSQGLGNLGGTALHQDNYDEALGYFQQALELDQEMKAWDMLPIHLYFSGIALFKGGRLEEAGRTLLQAIQRLEDNWLYHGNNDANKVSVLDGNTTVYQWLQQVLVAQGKL
jgi:tetratricopeptide (TPR) repeat protein